MESKYVLGHVGLNVTDLDASLAFYDRLFHFNVLRKSEEDGTEHAILGTSEGAVLTLWQQSTGSFSTGTPGLHHLAFKVSSPEEVLAIQQALKEMNVPLVYDGIVLHTEGKDSGGIYFRDPDGIRIEVFCAGGMKELAQVKVNGPACGFF